MLTSSLLLANVVWAGNPPTYPEFKLLRQDENWSALRDPTLRTDVFDPLKFIYLNHDGSSWLTLGGEVREQYEYFDNANWGKGPQDDNGYLLQRYMIHADAHLGENFRFFTQFKSGLEDGRNGGPRPTDRDEFDVHQLFTDERVTFGNNNSLILRIGRQEMSFGSQRLISVREFPNVRRSFDGLRATLHLNDWQIDAFATRPVEIEPGVFDDESSWHTTFWGLYAVAPFKLIPGGKVDLYYLGLDRDDATFDQGTAHERRHSVGTRLWGKHAGWDWNFEFIYQFGTFGDGGISAWTAASDTGYTFAQALWSPRLGLRADVTSGDRNPNDKDLQTFNPLFPKGAYFSDTGLIGPQNHIDMHPGIELHPARTITLNADMDFFWRESTHDGVYNIGQTVVRSDGNGGSSYVGSQANGKIEWRLQQHLTWTASYSHFFAGAFLHKNPPGKDVNYFSTWITFRF
jgi:hypothetical protein